MDVGEEKVLHPGKKYDKFKMPKIMREVYKDAPE